MEEELTSEWIVNTIEEGRKSEYWKLLKKVVLEWLKEEHSRLDKYKTYGIKDVQDAEKYNRAVDRIEYLKRFLTINETMISYHKSILERMKEKTEELLHIGESFVKEMFKR